MKEIHAKEGYYLTQAKEVDDRIFITVIKGVNVDESDWRDASVSEKEEWEELQSSSENQLVYE